MILLYIKLECWKLRCQSCGWWWNSKHGETFFLIWIWSMHSGGIRKERRFWFVGRCKESNFLLVPYYHTSLDSILFNDIDNFRHDPFIHTGHEAEILRNRYSDLERCRSNRLISGIFSCYFRDMWWSRSGYRQSLFRAGSQPSNGRPNERAGCKPRYI